MTLTGPCAIFQIKLVWISSSTTYSSILYPLQLVQNMSNPNPPAPPPSLVFNAYEGVGSDENGNIAKLFGLDRIKIDYTRLAAGETKSFKVHPRTNHAAYVLKGEGTLSNDEEGNGESKTVKTDDCFSFPSTNEGSSYNLKANDELGLIVFADIDSANMPVAVSFLQYTLLYVPILSRSVALPRLLIS